MNPVMEFVLSPHFLSCHDHICACVCDCVCVYDCVCDCACVCAKWLCPVFPGMQSKFTVSMCWMNSYGKQTDGCISIQTTQNWKKLMKSGNKRSSELISVGANFCGAPAPDAAPASWAGTSTPRLSPTTVSICQIQGEAAATEMVRDVKHRGLFGTVSTMVEMEAGLERQLAFASIWISLCDNIISSQGGR